jgi:hypothetical protein
MFPFVQFEFSHHIGPPAGRYLVGAQGDDETPSVSPGELGASDVLIIKVEGAAPSTGRRLGRRRAQPEAEQNGPRELTLTVVTVIKGTRMLADRDAAERLLTELRGSPERQEEWIADGLAIVNRAVSAYRACAADPYAIDVSRGDPGAVRVGYGPAAALTSGTWDAALAVPPPVQPRLDRTARLLPTQGMADVLTGRARTLEAEELVLRVLLDLEHGRLRAAALGLRAAQELLTAELAAELLNGSAEERFDRLERSRDAIAELAARATAQPLGDEDARRLGEHAEDAGALIDAWRYQSVHEA